MKLSAFLAATTLSAAVGITHAQSTPSYHFQNVNGVKVFYREAGNPESPTVVLLHGFPSSSHMFRELIPRLAKSYHVVAPDYPGFGYSDAPDRSHFQYTFAHLTEIMDRFLEAKRLNRYSLYVQDYGGPIGFRIAAAHPERVDSFIIQNSNAYREGISEAASGILVGFGENRNAETEKPVRGFMSLAGVKYQYETGSPNPSAISPDSYQLDAALLQRPDAIENQLDLIADYRSNVALYPDWQAYFRKSQPRTLILWGKSDPFFTVAGARAYSRDLKQVEFHLLDAGHFALEEKPEFFATTIARFLRKR